MQALNGGPAAYPAAFPQPISIPERVSGEEGVHRWDRVQASPRPSPGVPSVLAKIVPISETEDSLQGVESSPNQYFQAAPLPLPSHEEED